MSKSLIERLKENNFKYYNEHVILNSGRASPLDYFILVYRFLERHLPTE
jgi:hypothetical protein